MPDRGSRSAPRVPFGRPASGRRTEDEGEPVAEDVDDYRALEELKARYCRTLDLKDWKGFRRCFTDGFVSDTSRSGGMVIVGADQFVRFVSTTLAKAVTVHQVQQPELRLASPTAAEGVWAMEDVVRFVPGLTMHGYGHYLETYVRSEDGWRIATSTLTRLREELQTPILSVFVSDRVRRVMQFAAPRALPQST